MLTRVVITGMGVVSPNGIGKNSVLAGPSLMAKSGRKTYLPFDTSDLPVKIAGEIQDFNELDWMRPASANMSRAASRWPWPLPQRPSKTPALITKKCRSTKNARSALSWARAGGAHDFSDAQYHMYYAGKVKQISIFSIPAGPWAPCPARSACALASAA